VVVAAALALALIALWLVERRPAGGERGSRVVPTRSRDVFTGVTPSRAAPPPAPPPVAIEAPADAIRLIVRILDDATESPVEHGSLFRLDVEARPLLGAADSSGTVGIVVPRAPTTLLARAPGYVTASVAVPLPAPSTMDVRLRRADSIRGTVRRADGGIPDQVVRVAAQPSAARLELRDLALALRGEPVLGTSVATVESTGAFVLEGLDPKKRYEIVAGGGAYATAGTVGAAPGDTDVVVTVVTLFAAVVRVRGDDGRPLPHSPAELDGMSFVFTLPSGAKFAPPTACVLAGVPDDAFAIRSTTERKFFFASDTAAPSLGPMSVGVHLLGYHSAQFDLVAERWSGSVTILEIGLEPLASAFGTIRVAASVNLPPVDPLPRDTAPVGRLQVTPLGTEFENAAPFKIPIRQVSVVPMELSHVPFGRYRVSIVAENGLYRFPLSFGADPELTVGPEPAVFEWDASELGACEISIVDADGTAFDGSLQARLVPSGASKPWEFGSWFTIARPPYVATCLPAGEYAIQLRLHRGVLHGKSVSIVQRETLPDAAVSITAGRLTRVELRCPETPILDDLPPEQKVR
jgi:hypothetical protein